MSSPSPIVIKRKLRNARRRRAFWGLLNRWCLAMADALVASQKANAALEGLAKRLSEPPPWSEVEPIIKAAERHA